MNFASFNNLGQQKKQYKQLLKKAQQAGIYFSVLPEEKSNKTILKKSTYVLESKDFISQKLPPFNYVAQVLESALKDKYRGPLYLQAELEVDPEKQKHTVVKEINKVKKQIKNCRQVGFYNLQIKINLKTDLAKEIKDNLNRFVDFLDSKVEKKPRWQKQDKIKTKIIYT